MTSASLIRSARRRAGLTQGELAARLGTTQSVIARWERGRVEPAFETLDRVVRACGLELSVELQVPDPAEIASIQRNLALSPAARLDQLVRTVAFARAGRAAVAAKRRRG